MIIPEHALQRALSLLSSDYENIEEEGNGMIAACAFALIAMAIELKRANDLHEHDQRWEAEKDNRQWNSKQHT